MEKSIRRLIILCLLYCSVINRLQSQDSVVISFRPAGIGMWFTENICFTSKNAYYIKEWDPGPINCRIRLNRYQKFHQFLVENISPKNLARLEEKYKRKTNGCQPICDMTFYFYKNGEKNDVYFVTFCENNYNLEDSSIVSKIGRFLQAFYNEHSCEKKYITHSVKKGESYKGICTKYDIDGFTLKQFNEVYYEDFKKLNKRQFNLEKVFYENEYLYENDVILIPCLPQKVSKYE